MSDSFVVSYGDTTLYESDVKSVAEGQWLTDALLASYQEYLTHEECKDAVERNKLFFVSPSLVMLLSFLNGKRADDSESCMQSAVQKMFS
jgi:hypothetical protein